MSAVLKEQADFATSAGHWYCAKTGTEKTEELGPREAQRLLGHASVTTTETYIRNRRGDRVKPLK